MGCIKANIGGTSQVSFQVGLNGPIIYQDTSAPSPLLGKDGDLYIRIGVSSTTFQKIAGTWTLFSSASFSGVNFSFEEVVTPVVVSGSQQMAIFDELKIEAGGELQVEGSVIIEL